MHAVAALAATTATYHLSCSPNMHFGMSLPLRITILCLAIELHKDLRDKGNFSMGNNVLMIGLCHPPYTETDPTYMLGPWNTLHTGSCNLINCNWHHQPPPSFPAQQYVLGEIATASEMRAAVFAGAESRSAVACTSLLQGGLRCSELQY